jgi:ribosomal protein L11 methyltransferase
MNLCEVKVEIRHADTEQADNAQLELGVEGWCVYEDVLVKRAWVQGIFPTRVEADARWSELLPLLEAAGVSLLEAPVFREMEERDWKDSYKAHFKPSRFGRLHWVPEWERQSYALPAGDVVLWLDPGLAFGTGNHETTRLCCERLVSWAATDNAALRGSRRIIDAGCGSGILALSSSLLGYTSIEGFDNDPEAVRISEENAALNGLQGRVRFFTGDLISGLEGRQADFLMANILAVVLMQFSSQLLAAVAPGGTLVLSGILAQERDQVRDHFAKAAPGWSVDSRIMGEWADVVLVRPE